MWDDDVFPLPLQNHLLQVEQRTTDWTLWMPQYLRWYWYALRNRRNSTRKP